MTPTERLAPEACPSWLGSSKSAVNYIIKAIVDHHGLVMNNGSPMSRRPAMEHLQKVAPRDPPLEDSLSVVGQLHGHFYNKHMSEAQHTEAMTAYILFSST